MNLLLDQEGIDDFLLDANGKSCKDVAKCKDVVKAIQGAYSSELLQALLGNQTTVEPYHPLHSRLSIIP